MPPQQRRLRKFGAEIVGGGVRFRLWAPDQRTVSLILDGAITHRMRPVENGWYEIHASAAVRFRSNISRASRSALTFRMGGKGVPRPFALH
jgi:Carbohydrate-binding module 48 (Isoamylase N-terminal domain)